MRATLVTLRVAAPGFKIIGLIDAPAFDTGISDFVSPDQAIADGKCDDTTCVLTLPIILLTLTGTTGVCSNCRPPLVNFTVAPRAPTAACSSPSLFVVAPW